MGSTFASIHVRADKVRAVDAALKRFVRGQAFRSRPLGGWVSIYDESADHDPGEMIRLSAALSDALVTVAVAFAVYDSDVTVLCVYDGRRAVGLYVSNPMFGGGDGEESPPWPDVPPLAAADLAALARAGVTAAEIDGLLRGPPKVEPFVLEECRVQELAGRLGIDPDRTVFGFSYVAGDPGSVPFLAELRVVAAARPKSLRMPAVRGDVGRARQYLAAGADPNEPGVLPVALSLGHDEVVTALLDAGADPSTDPHAMASAVRCGAETFHRILTAVAPGPDALNLILFHAAGCGRAANLKTLLAAGAQANVMMPDSWVTPLMAAAGWRNLDAVRVLLDAGAYAGHKDSHGRTAADFARLPLPTFGTAGSAEEASATMGEHPLIALRTSGTNGSEGDVPAIVELLAGRT